jgi:DNA gyrase subunit A
VIVRMRSDAIPQQSRAATGVRLQKLDSGDRLAEVVLVPPSADEEDALAVVDPELEDAAALGVAEPLASDASLEEAAPGDGPEASEAAD